MEHNPSLISIFHTEKIRMDQKFLEPFHGCPFITGIDIFAPDYIPSNKADKELHLNPFRAARNLCINGNCSEDDGQWKDTSKWEYLNEVEHLTGYHFDRLRPVKEQLYFIGDRIAAMYWDSASGDVTNMFWMYDHQDYQLPRSCFDRIITVPFENTTLPIPKGYDFICELVYRKEYMAPIKEYDHDYLYKQIEHLRNWFFKNGRDFPIFGDLTCSPNLPESI